MREWGDMNCSYCGIMCMGSEGGHARRKDRHADKGEGQGTDLVHRMKLCEMYMLHIRYISTTCTGYCMPWILYYLWSCTSPLVSQWSQSCFCMFRERERVATITLLLAKCQLHAWEVLIMHSDNNISVFAELLETIMLLECLSEYQLHSMVAKQLPYCVLVKASSS